MTDLLKIVLSLSLSGTLLILVLLLCKPLYAHKLSRQWQYYICLVVVARLLLPFTPATSPVGNFFDHTMVQNDTPLFSDTALDASLAPQTHTATSGVREPETPSMQEVVESATQNIGLICGFVWFLVAAGLFIRNVTLYQSFVKFVKAGRREVSSLKLWEHLGKLVARTGIKSTVALYTNPLISSPLLIGFLHPCILLPSEALSEPDFENTILHELTHYKRRDMFYKWLVQIALCLHWFNPFVHAMAKEINRACEFSCDEAVIKNFDKQAQRTYGSTLLHALGQGGPYQDSLASVTLRENAETLKERLDAIMNFKKSQRK